MIKKIFAVLAFPFLCSCEEVVFVDDISEEQVELIAPADDVIFNTTEINFYWEEVPAVDNYKLQIATPSFSEAMEIVEDTLVTSQNYTGTLNSGNYEWRVKAVNSEYQTEFTTYSFVIVE
ncbi:MAG TPA: hypothetical protein VFM70_04665 [Salinimicrobium sp.]|nr:hypothetical protein [Salinimicrobium sp.]